MRHRPAAHRFQTRRDGPSDSDSIVPAGLPGQRRLAPLGPGALHATGRQVELGRVKKLDAEGVRQRPGVSSPNAARSIPEGVLHASLPRGSEFACDMTSAASPIVGRSSPMPRPFGGSFLISARLRSQQ